MKKIFTSVLMLGCVVALLSSCKKDEVKTVAGAGAGTTLTLSTSTPALSKANLTATAITITGTPQNYGFKAAVNYAFEIAVKGTNFASPTTVDLSTGVLTKSYTVQDFNNLLLGMKLPVNVSAQLEVRLKSSLSTTAGITYSNVGTITATPFPLTSWIYVVGAFQGWNAASPDSLISALGNGVYTGIINYTAGNNEFLILPAKNFNNKYATAGSSVPSTTATYNAANNLKAPTTAGQYLVTFDSNQGTISFALANLYSVIGSTTAGGNFSTDVDLTKYVNDGVTGWTATFAMTAGEFKFRQNHDWSFSWGDVAPVDGKTATSSNGSNIKLAAAGNYKVGFNIAPSAIGSTPATTATYTVVKQ